MFCLVKDVIKTVPWTIQFSFFVLHSIVVFLLLFCFVFFSLVFFFGIILTSAIQIRVVLFIASKAAFSWQQTTMLCSYGVEVNHLGLFKLS